MTLERDTVRSRAEFPKWEEIGQGNIALASPASRIAEMQLEMENWRKQRVKDGER
jgi:hypothetical protein